jgi:uncharacterized protein YaiL (DUF2058 family)
MQNLREKLLKAGLVSEKQANEAAREKRPPKQQHRAREEQLSAEEQQRRDAFAAHEAEQAEERRKEAAKVAEARMQSERARRLRQLVESNRLSNQDKKGEITFHYVRRSGKIGRLDVSAELQQKLESGAAAVVEDPSSPDCAVVMAEAAKRIYEVDPHAIRFWFGPEKPIGFSDAGEG